MNNKTFDFFFEKHIGLGFRWEEWNGGFMVSLSIPFLTMTVKLFDS